MIHYLDELNHASVIDGCRLSRAKILVLPSIKNVSHAEAACSVKNEPGKKLLTRTVCSRWTATSGHWRGYRAAEKYGRS